GDPGASVMATPEPVLPSAGGAGGAGDTTDAIDGGAGGEPGEPDPAVLEASCGGLADGVYCGGDLSSLGDPKSSYQCSGGAIVAVSACPGGCKYGVCAVDTASAGGTPDESVDPCGDCVAERCSKQDEQCGQTGSCGPLDKCMAAQCADRCGGLVPTTE
ncbi:MAG TPA: hypothetical protein VM686_02965, partial [Polyangiaceae bacterium]|nr:hypothetical protein [Polyangiaceae bacterium]